MTDMERKVADYVKLHNMLSEGDGVIVGVSGGADSMCLLNMLIFLRERLKLKLVVLHVNHGIRGEAADADEHFVEEFCRKHGVTFECVHACVPEMAKEQGLTEEEAGRKLRYASFFEACKRNGCNKIAVAHNSNDNAETILFNIARGSGISGLRGISPVRSEGSVTVIRPLLECTRKEIEAYLAEKGIGYCTDETNLEDEYSRNRIRHTVLPILCEQINSAADVHLTELAARASELEGFVARLTDDTVEELKRNGSLIFAFEKDTAAGNTGIGQSTEAADNRASKKPVRTELETGALSDTDPVIVGSVLRKIVGDMAGSLKDIESIHIASVAALIDKSVGRKVNLPYGIIVRRDYSKLIFEKKTADLCERKGEGRERRNGEELCRETLAAVPGEYELPFEQGHLRLSLIPNEKSINIPKNDYTKFFDYDKIIGELTLRTRETGDYICIRRTAGSKELSRKSLKTWLIDNKVASSERDLLPLLAEGNHVLWIIGKRGDDAYPVTETTLRILKAEFIR